MKILVNTDASIQGNEKLEQHTQATVQSVLGHLADHITRVEVHLSDVNSSKGGNDDKRCLLDHTLGRIHDRKERSQPTDVDIDID